MNYPIPAKTYSSASEMLASYSAAHARLVGTPEKQVRPALLPISGGRTMAQVYWDEQAGCPVNMLGDCDPHFIMQYMAAKSGFPVSLMASASMDRTLSKVRQETMYLIRLHVPNASYPFIGRLFNRDHSTAVQSINAHISRIGAPNLEAAIPIIPTIPSACRHTLTDVEPFETNAVCAPSYEVTPNSTGGANG